MNNYLRFCLFLIVGLAIFSSSLFAQSELWKDVSESDIILKGEKLINPTEYRTVSLEVEAMKNLLDNAPMEYSSAGTNRPLLVTLPLPDGSFGRFLCVESPVMAPALALQYPEIKTYLGKGVDDKTATVRFDLTPHGFHAMILSAEGNVFIDPHNKGDIKNYTVYYTKDFQKQGVVKDCELLINKDLVPEFDYINQSKSAPPTGPQLRTYRLALACTGEYATFHGGTVALALAAMVTTVNRVDGVYETEVAVRMVLIANNDLIVYTNSSTDPYTNNNGSTMLGQNQTTIDNTIGSANYDIGHVVSTGGGGVAYLGVICTAGWKARGVTGSYSPVGDPFDIDYVAHEMGHQFGGNHSFNGTAGSCSGGNRNAATAYEPGSGSTIMCYAGICSSNNLQSNSDPYFHTIGFDEIVNYTNLGSGNSCAVITATGNHAPVVTVPTGGFYIPKSTPFALTGSATDADNDVLTYSWEEFDLGPAGAPTSPSGNAPIFRAFNPTTSPTRTFPKLSSLLNNASVIGEILPTYARSLTFRLVARDNKPGAGGVNYASLAFQVDANSGPFLVTSPNTNVSWPGLSSQVVTWNVANTSASPVSCANVNILLSVDGGNTYPFVLAANTPNDGTETIVLPDNPCVTARVKVEAVGNVFFDISNTNFTIDQAIPVELISFNASVVDDGIKIEWATATETNNAGFTLERSRDEQNFEAVTYQKGSGTSTTKNLYSYVDGSVEYGVYFYRLKQSDFDGSFKYLNVLSVDFGTPKQFSLSQNYPNPFNPSTTIKYTVPEKSNIKLAIYDVLGREVALLVNESKEAGNYEITFDAKNLTSGIYFYELKTNNFSKTNKMILAK
ncbi:MAG: T9SS type A sorting domain-containing protein [Ignavibacteriaceae bacterium]|nr:T9SS type A sorting domain-containing protein [Ignavibacteriaceae bacterium]